ncbi:MAG: GDSL-type esterase/lipase family protein, partial [Caulobacter sp.]
MHPTLPRRGILAALPSVIAASAFAQTRPTLTILGDSITSGYGLPAADSLPRQLGLALARRGAGWRVHGAGVAGDTSGQALRRLDRSLAAGTSLCIVALGANDVLVGAPPERLSANLTTIVDRLSSRQIRVILAGLRLPPYLGARYAADFNAVFADLGRRAGVTLIPNWLEGVVGDPTLN